MPKFFLKKFVILKMITDSFLIEKWETLEIARRYDCKKSLLYLSTFSHPLFCAQQSLQFKSKVFSLPQPFSQFRLRRGTSEQSSLVRTDTVLISFFFLKLQKGITVTDSLSLRLRKLVYCR